MAEPRPDSPRPFFPGDFALVTINSPKPGAKRIPSPSELEYLLLRAEGFSTQQIVELGISEDAAHSRRASVVRRLGTKGVSQSIAVCFDREILLMDEYVIESQQRLIGTNPYGLTEMETRALRNKILHGEDSEPNPLKPSSIDNAAIRMRRKMGLGRDAIPFGPALMYGYITPEEVHELAQTERINPHFSERYRQSLELVALGLRPAERAALLPLGERRAQDVIPEINAVLGTNSILESVLLAARRRLINTSDLADKLTTKQPYTVDTFMSLLEERERQALELIIKTNGLVGTNEELADKLKTTVGSIKSRFRCIRDKFGLGKIPAIVVYLEATRRRRTESTRESERRKRALRETQSKEEERLRLIGEQSERRRQLVQQTHRQHTTWPRKKIIT